MPLEVRPITRSAVRAVAAFLHANLSDGRIPAAIWAGVMEVPWKVDAPNYGFMLVKDPADEDPANEAPAPRDDQVVGVYLALYSERIFDTRPEKYCNLGAWCVLPAYRMHSVRLLKALLAQEGYHFVDLSPSGNVIPLNKRLGFTSLDTTTALIPNLPWPSLPGRRRLSADPAVIERTLSGDQLAIYRDHARTAAAHHLVLIDGPRWCYVIFRKDRRKDLPLFGSIVHVSDQELFGRMVRQVSRFLLLHHGILATMAELRVVGRRPRPSVMLRSPRPKMFRSHSLKADQVDYLYSELVCVSW